MTTESIKVISVDIEVDGKTSLFVLLADDGTVNRMGTGTVDNIDRDLFIGLAREPLFEQLRDRVQPEWLSLGGEYDLPEKEGRKCRLTIMFGSDAGQQVGLRFHYGSESEGPPDEICEFVGESARLTDAWHQDQKIIAGGRKDVKPWWKIW